MAYETEMRRAVELAKKASSEIMSIYYGGMEITEKSDGTPVTNADILANRIIASGLHETFPSDGIVSEEEASISGDRCWYIDPIDGTRGFTYHNDHFAIHIGLAQEGKPVLGLVYKPTTGEYYCATKGDGAFRVSPTGNHIRLQKPDCDLALDEMILVGSKKLFYQEPGKTLLERLKPKFVQVSGSEGLRIMHLVNGVANYHFTAYPDLGTWDVCAPQAIADEAGFNTCLVDGSVPNYSGQRNIGGGIVVAPSKEKAAQIAEIVRSVTGKNLKSDF